MDAFEEAREMDELVLESLRLFLREAGELAALLALEQVVVPGDAPLDRDEVRQEATQPPLVDEVHLRASRLFGDRFLGLLLGADEEDLLSPRRHGPHEVIGVVEAAERLLQIDDVDTVALHEDESLHLRVPAAGLMTKVHAALEELFHGDDRHVIGTSLSFLRSRPSARGAGAPLSGRARSGSRHGRGTCVLNFSIPVAVLDRKARGDGNWHDPCRVV